MSNKDSKNFICIIEGKDWTDKEIIKFVSDLYEKFDVDRRKLKANLTLTSKYFDGINTVVRFQPLVAGGIMPPVPPTPGDPDRPDPPVIVNEIKLLVETTKNIIYYYRRPTNYK